MNRKITVMALTVVVAIASAPGLKADVKSDEKGLVKFEGMLGKVVSVFGGRAAREGVKTSVAVKGDRKVSTNDTTGQIIDLREEKVYDLDLRKKTYKATTFAEIRRRIEEAQRRAKEEAKKAQAEAPAPSPQPSAANEQPNERQLEVDFDLKETGQTKSINGFDVREIVMTITLREKGKTLDENGGMVLTSDIWMGPQIPAMKEVVDFDVRYAKAIAGPVVAGASADEMASALAMYPMIKQAIARMKAENVKMDGTPIQTLTTIEAVKSAEQIAAEQKEQQDARASGSSGGGIGGLIGGFAARRMRGNTAAQSSNARATVMTITNEVLKVTTSVADSDLAIPSGYKQDR